MTVLSDIPMAIKDEEFISVTGPSGCGKLFLPMPFS